MSNLIRIGTRGSRLAMTQTEWVAGRLRAANPGLEVRIEVFRTEGDRDRATPLVQMAGVGFFVKELETALLDGRIDLAVHSMKDVPTQVPDGLDMAVAVPEREDPRDCLVTVGGLRLEELPRGATVGSSSPRRRAMLLALRPDLAFIDLRGNVETRLAKLEAGVCQATILARAGLGRLGALDDRVVTLETDVLLPAAGQGALGLECRADDEAVHRTLAPLDHPPTRATVIAERALVRRLGAGCQTPLGVLGTIDSQGRLVLDAYLVAPGGREAIRRRTMGPPAHTEALGQSLAETLLGAGAARLMA
jgi:hydroxymethylbilane synthase